MERLLDPRTLAAVIAATPDLPTERDRAREVIIALKVLTCPDSSRDYFKATLGDIALETATIDGTEITAKETGSIVRRLGLTSRRTRDGYICIWSREQLEILSHALLSEEPEKLKVYQIGNKIPMPPTWQDEEIVKSEDPSAATEGPSGETNSVLIVHPAAEPACTPIPELVEGSGDVLKP